MRKCQERTRRRAALFFFLIVLLACCACAFALDPSLDASQYAHTAWRIRDGFTKGVIFSIAQTPDGYLWLGTEFGLLRFDGVRALPWQPSENQHILAGSIRSLLVSRNGTLWIGARGLASWKNGKLTEYPEFAQLFVYTIVEDHEGTIWVGGGGIPFGKLCAIRGSVHCFGDDGRFGRWVVAVYEDHGRNLWVAVKDGLWRWKPGPPKYYSLPGNPDSIKAIAEDPEGAILVAWKGGIYRLINGRTEAYSPVRTLAQFQARKILRDRDGSLWVGARGLVHVHQERADVLLQADGLSGDEVLDVFEDHEGDIWVSTLEGLDRFREYAVATIGVKQGLSAGQVGSALVDKGGSVLVSTLGGLNRWDQGRITIPPTGNTKRDGKINGNDPSSLFQDDRGRIWVGTHRELGYLEDFRFTSINDVPAGQILSIAQDNAGNLWVINEDAGLFRISPRNEVRQIPWSALGHKDHASVLVADRRHGGLWIGFFLGGLAYISSDRQVRTSYTVADGLGAGRVGDFLFDGDGTLWVSTEGGLSRLKNDRVATLASKNGLPCDAVYWATTDDYGSIWLYTSCGLVRIDRVDLASWAAAVDKGDFKAQLVHWTLFDNSDGVRMLSSPGHFHPQVAKTQDGKLWFPSLPGISVIDPRHIPFNKVAPPVHIEKVTADGKAYETSRGLHLPARIRDLTIDYTALSFVAPQKIHFRFKLEGQDPGWREVINEREVQYSNLPPKHYRFRVLACNNSGVWNDEGASLDFVIPPAWYQTNWFRALCASVFLALLWMAYQMRVRHLRHEFAITLDARVGERTRIARELHDTLLQSLHGLLLNFQRAANLLPDRPIEAKERLDGAIDQAAQAITEGRDAVQGLRSSTVVANELAGAIRSLGEELAAKQTSENSPVFDVAVEGTPRDLNPILRDDIYRIAGEALRNAFQHAEARHIEVELRYDERQLRLRIRDNGKGIATDVFQNKGRSGHWGLQGMRERAKLVGGHLEIWSEMDSGTEIELSIPAAAAYATAARRHTPKRTVVKS